MYLEKIIYNNLDHNNSCIWVGKGKILGSARGKHQIDNQGIVSHSKGISFEHYGSITFLLYGYELS